MFIKRYANYWNEIGIELKLDATVLEIIRENYATHHNKTEECCKTMIRKWLEVSSNATWDNLLKAIDAVTVVVTQVYPTFGKEKFG